MAMWVELFCKNILKCSSSPFCQFFRCLAAVERCRLRISRNLLRFFSIAFTLLGGSQKVPDSNMSLVVSPILWSRRSVASSFDDQRGGAERLIRTSFRAILSMASGLRPGTRTDLGFMVEFKRATDSASFSSALHFLRDRAYFICLSYIAGGQRTSKNDTAFNILEIRSRESEI